MPTKWKFLTVLQKDLLGFVTNIIILKRQDKLLNVDWKALRDNENGSAYDIEAIYHNHKGIILDGW